MHTNAERRVVALTCELWKAYKALEDEEGPSHPSHRADVADAIHDVQRVVAMRLARRIDPDVWGGSVR